MSDNIKVVVKVRPLITREIEEKLSKQWRVKNNKICQLDPNGKESGVSFTYDKVYDVDAKTSDVYNDIAKPIVEAAISGINGTIFAYGQTSSGKTYTMSGTADSPGITQLAVMDLFEIIKSKEDRDFLLRVSYMEIYNETIKDLLNVKNDKIKIHETYTGVKVDVKEEVTSTPDEVLAIMRKGEMNRQIGATNMNEASSRSHSIFQITIESREHTESGDEVGSVNVSQLNLVDLAGSERAGQTGATGKRFIEGTHINKSLSTLALVIKQLSEDNKFANYRDSKLTRILQNSLGGNAKTSIICAVTPAAVDETISTLSFANRAKFIKNTPEVNAVATNATMIQKLTKELSKLQSQLESKKNLEKDNNLLTKKIEELQRQIIYGFSARSDEFLPPSSRRKTWCAGRRQTIDVPPRAPPRFCTPALKYNPMSFPSQSELLPAPSLARVPEEAALAATPHKDKNVNSSDDVIQIDSDDEDGSDKTEVCSPYHKCYRSTKTPPCVLREKAVRAERNLHDIVELTEREKIYGPTVTELMERLEQNTTVISKLEEEINNLNLKCEDKAKELDKMMGLVQTSQQQIETITSDKTELENICKDYGTKLTDMEVSYETLKRKAKLREEELLSLLEEQEAIQNKRNGKTIPKIIDKEINFMDMSKDISLVNSDNENSIMVPDSETTKLQEILVKDLQSQITSKNHHIAEIEKQLAMYTEKITQLENSNEIAQRHIADLNEKTIDLDLTNSMLNSKIETLQGTIKSQKENLDSANEDLISYNTLIIELQTKLTNKEMKSVILDDSELESMITNELKLISNNENLKNIILSLKNAINIRNQEIEGLKMSETYLKSKNEELNEQNKSHEEQIKELMVKLDEYSHTVEEIKETLTAKDNIIASSLKRSQSYDELFSGFQKATIDIQTVVQNMIDEEVNVITDNSNIEETLAALNGCAISLEQAVSEYNANRKVLLELAAIKDKHDLLQQKNEDITKTEINSRKEYDKLLIQHEQLFNEHQKFLEELESNNRLLQDYSEQKDALSVLIQDNNIELQYLKDKNVELLDEVEKLKKSLEQAQENHDSAIQSLRDKNVELLDEMDKLKQSQEQAEYYSNQRIAEELESKNQVIKDYNEEKVTMSKLIHDNNIEIQSLKDKKVELLCELEKLKKSLEQAEENHANQNIAEGLESNDRLLNDYLAEKDTMSKLIQDSNKAIQSLRDKNVELLEEVDKLKLSLAQAEHYANQRIAEELESKNRLIKDYNEEKVTMTKLIQDNYIEIQSLKVKKDELLDEVEKFQQSLEQAEEYSAMLKEKRTSFSSSDNSIPISNIRKSLSNIIEVNETMMPQSLISLCCNRIIDILSKSNEDDLKVTPSNSDCIVTVSSSETLTARCQCSDLTLELQSTLEQVSSLQKQVDFYRNANKDLLEEQKQIRCEIDLILEPANELQKKISNHRTHLSTLTATTYAENRLLRSQVQFLKHHLSRLHNVCQRDIPEFKNQLHNLLSLLKSENMIFDHHNMSFKRYSLPIILDNNATINTLKNESTFDGDLLMLDTNVTFGTSAENITSMCQDQTCFDMTQESESQDAAGCLASSSLLPTIDPKSLEILIDDNRKMNERLDCLREENNKLKDQALKYAECKLDETNTSENSQNSIITLVNKSAIVENETAHARCPNCEDKANILTKLDMLNKELMNLQKEKDVLEIKYKNLSLEVPSTEALVRKLKETENQLDNKTTQLNKELSQKTTEIRQLLEENDTLSTQLMENVTEVDDLRKEIDDLKNRNLELLEKVTNPDVTSNQSDLETSSRCNKICSLRNELHASREDCKKINDEVTTIKNHLERSNLSMAQSMELDQSVSESNLCNIANEVDNFTDQTNNIYSSNRSTPPDDKDLYTVDKTDCINYYKEITDAETENFNADMKIVDILKLMYDSLTTNHANEVQNLSNKLMDFEESQLELASQLEDLTFKYNEACIKLEEYENSVTSLQTLSRVLKNNIDSMNSQIANNNADQVQLFRDKILHVLDSDFNLETKNVFESLIDGIASKHEKDLGTIKEQYAILQNQMESVAAERNIVNDSIKQMKQQLNNKENEYNLLNAQKLRIHDISNAVTLDIVNKDKQIKETFVWCCEKLLECNLISQDEIDNTLPMNERIAVCFQKIIAKTKECEKNSSSIIKEKELLLEKLYSNNNVLEVDNKTLKEFTDSLSKENETKAILIENLSEEIISLKTKITQNTLEIDNKEAQIQELMDRIQNMELEHSKLLSLNEAIAKEKETYMAELEKSTNTVTSNLKTIEELKSECQRLVEENRVLAEEKADFHSKLQEFERLEMIVKTHEKTVEVQCQMYNRLLKENAEKESKMEELKKEVETVLKDLQSTKETLLAISTMKDTLEVKVSELESELNSLARSRRSLAAARGAARREDGLDDEVSKVEALFASRPKPEELFDAEAGSAGSSNRSTPVRNRRRESAPARDSDGEECSRPSSVAERRRRRQSIHDAQRAHAHADSPLAKHLREELSRLKSAESMPEYNPSETISLKKELLFCKQELEELRERYKELDEECETCAQYLRERDQQCFTLKKERDDLEKVISELKDSSKSVNKTHVAVNTDEAWFPHSVVVDRMSFDAEVDKNKRLSRAVDEFRHKNRELKAALANMHRAMEAAGEDSAARELESSKRELEKYKREVDELREQYRVVSEECDTYAQCLREKETALSRLEKEKNDLEEKLAEWSRGRRAAGIGEESKVEALFASRPKPEELFEAEAGSAGSSNRSTPVRNRRRESAPARDSDGEECSRPSSVAERRRRRQSIHDAQRAHAHAESPLANHLREELSRLRAADPVPEFSASEVIQLKEQLLSSQQELEELRERYKELDEECETCAQYLRERDQQCFTLKRERDDLERLISSLRGSSESASAPPAERRVHASVNTDEAWFPHSVVVDRMSFDAEVDKNKRLSRAVDEFRHKNRELKAALANMHRAMEAAGEDSAARELESTKRELEEYKRELDELREQYREAKLAEVKSTRGDREYRRHSEQDARRHVATETGEELLSSVVERDTAPASLLARIEWLSGEKAALERRLRAAAGVAPGSANVAPGSANVAPGSAIVKSQQIDDLLRENHKLKKVNAKLITFYKKRGKASDDADQENQSKDQG